jgi:invasion protein IalB
MTGDRRRFSAIMALALLCALSGAAAAQPQPSPQQTSATYDDWIVRCEIKPGPPRQKSCEMVQFTQLKGRPGVITQIAIGQAAKGQPVPLVIQVPISVWLPAGVTLSTGGKDEACRSPTRSACRPPA